MVLLAVAIAIVVCAAIFTSLDVFIALSERKTACGWKPGYFNIVYKPEIDTKFYRAHLVGVVERIGNMMLYIIEIHPEDADKALAWTVPETKLYEGHLLEKGKFYKLVFKKELYD